MKYEIQFALGTYRVWRVAANGNATVVKTFKTREAAERWAAKQK